MSVITTTGLKDLIEGFTVDFEAIGVELGTVAAGVAPAVAVAASILTGVVVGKLFSDIWNAERKKIPQVVANLKEAIAQVQTLGTPIANVERDYTANSVTIEKQQALVNIFLKTNINYAKQIENLKKLDKALVEQQKSFITTLAIATIAGNDNTFYTQNRDDIDKLINAWVARDAAITQLVKAVNQILEVLSNLKNFIEDAYKTIVTLIGTPLPTHTVTEEEIEVLIASGTITEELAELLGVNIFLRTRTKTRTRTRTKSKKKWKKTRNKRRTKRKKRKLPEKIRRLEVDTSGVSEWVKKLTFTFPTKKPLRSDDKGRLEVHIKNGSMVVFNRVKRGTFSVMANYFGTGYRVWSQFWKHRIVNRTVLSWFIKRINKNDREIGIEEEITSNKVKYS